MKKQTEGQIDIWGGVLERQHIVSFSGGKDSTYMLLEMIRRGMRIDVVLNADTGMEFPAMYDHIDKVEEFLQRERGIGITRIKSEKSFEWFMFEARRDGLPGYGWPNSTIRWCTGYLKDDVIEKYIKNFPLEPNQYVAIALDESWRLDRKQNQRLFHIHPLVEWGVTEAEALKGCYKLGYKWGGLYEKFNRVSCFCCPLNSLKQLRILREEFPDMWARIREMDERAIAKYGRNSSLGQFKENASIYMLELRFDLEKEWITAGKKINSKAFFAALKSTYQKKGVA